MTFFRTTIAAAALVSGAFAANAASAYERWIDVVNSGNAAIYSIYITTVADSSYGRDLLGNSMIPAGYQARVEPDVSNGYCKFDMLITYETGQEVKLWGVNLCEATTIDTNGRHFNVDYI